MKIYLAGQTNFGNRGCEALVRSTSLMLKKQLPDVEIICPLKNPDIDGAQWPNAKDFGVKFVRAPVFPKRWTWWHRSCRVLPFIEKLGMPKFSLDKETRQVIQTSDYMIMTGGDVLSLDYGVPSLYIWSSIVERIIDNGIPSILWAASVGPFSSKPHVEKAMLKHLKKYKFITVRESASYDYLMSLGLNNIHLVADPAFNLEKDTNIEFPFDSDVDVIGLNISPLIRKFRATEKDRCLLDNEVIKFIQHLLDKTNYSILLIPHVDDLEGSDDNSDYAYMKSLLSGVNLTDRLVLLDRTYNTGQLKSFISKCRYFIGARTHSTIAALSTRVPTISIAYSVKAKGINLDLFGSTDYVVDTPNVSLATLVAALCLLEEDEQKIIQTLSDKVPKLQEKAYESVAKMIESVVGRSM